MTVATVADTSWPVTRWFKHVTRPAARARLVDDSIRYVGAMAVVFTVEAICGYYLWHGATVHVHLPDELGWAPQFGLVGGAAVGTRAWHRGVGQAAKWGCAASLVGLAFTILDAGIAALLRDGIVVVKPGFLALGLIVQCVIIGWLAVHTLFSAVKEQPATESPRVPTVPVRVAMPAPPRHAAPEQTAIDEAIPPDMQAIEAPVDTGPPTDPFPPQLDNEGDQEALDRLVAMRAVHGERGRHKERAALSCGWPRYGRIVTALDQEQAV